MGRLTIALLVLMPVLAQNRLEFEVASVKPSKAGGRGGAIKPLPGGQTYLATNMPVKMMIKLMYHLNDRQISGGPDWLEKDGYDIEAKADSPHNLEELHIMFQNLLADRFKLKFRRETKEMSSYVLIVDKSGQKMKLNDSENRFDIPIRSRFGTVEAIRCSMSYFAWTLSQQLNQPVMDQTKLEGTYDFKLEFTPELPDNIPAEVRERLPQTNGPDLFTALRQQLGLKLESRKGPVETIVIEHAEKPAEN